MSDAFDRLPPHSLDAEMCLIASAILSKDIALEVIAMPVLPRDFYLTDHSLIFAAIRDLTLSGKSVDAVILRDELGRRNQLDLIGGSAYIAQCLGTVPSAAHGPEYAERVLEKSRQRAALSIFEDGMRRIYNGNADSAEILGSAQTAITEIIAGHSGSGVVTAGEMLEEAFANIGKPANLVSYGMPSLDQNLGGMDEGETIIIGARPSMGKSTLGRQLGVLIANAGTPVLFVSLEERKPKVSRNILSWWGGVENEKLRRGDVTPAQMDNIRVAIDHLKTIPFYFVQGVSRADRIRALVQSHIIRFGVKVVVVDYVQEVDAGGDSATDRATRASRAMNRIAKDLGVRLILMAQLNRDVTKREGNRPQMADLKQTGQIEQDADTLIFVHREDYYRKDEPGYQPTNQAELIIEKARDGQRGYSIFLRSRLAFQCFDDPLWRPPEIERVEPMFNEREAEF